MVTIRPETPRDYAAIADINIHAFGGRIAESLVVALLRQCKTFDPELSLVAEQNGRLVGHVLFTPYTISLLEQPVRAVNLAPIAIAPNFQKQGVGSALIREGHRIAREKGYAVSFLLGHTEYYPRFGYKTGVYGVSSVVVKKSDLPTTTKEGLETRPPIPTDGITLSGLQLQVDYNVDFTLVPDSSLLEWASPNTNIEATVYLRDKTVVGYTRVDKNKPDKPRVFLAHNAEIAWAIAAILMGDRDSLTLPIHPYSTLASVFGKPQVQSWDAGMACGLVPDTPFDRFYAALQRGGRLPGRVIWPTAFDST
jgi:putative acetyltransferase